MRSLSLKYKFSAIVCFTSVEFSFLYIPHMSFSSLFLGGGGATGGRGVWTPHFSKGWLLRFIQKCNRNDLSGGVSQIKRFCHVIKRSNEYSRQIITLNSAIRTFPGFSECMKGVVTQNFPRATPQTFRVLAPPLFWL